MKAKYKGFTLIEITLVMVLISILIAITTPLISNVIARNDVGSAHESLYNALLRAQQLSKNQYKDSQWRVCLDNTNKQYTITSGTCSDPTNAEIIKIASNITISSTQTLDILFKSISGELDNTSKYPNTITLTGGGASKSIKINPSGLIDKEFNTTLGSTITTPSIVTDGLVLNLDAGNINSYPGLNGTGNTWFDLSGNNNNGTLLNGVGYNSANGGSLVFDGVNDYVNIPYLLLSGSQDFTINIWLKSNNHIGGTIFGNYPAGNLQLFHGTNYIGMWLNNSSTYLVSPGTEFTTNPVFFTAQRIGGNETRVYLNTVLKKTGASTSTIGSVSNFRMGTNTSGGEVYNGNIAQTSVYNRALTESEIQQNFNATRGRFGL